MSRITPRRRNSPRRPEAWATHSLMPLTAIENKRKTTPRPMATSSSSDIWALSPLNHSDTIIDVHAPSLGEVGRAIGRIRIQFLGGGGVDGLCDSVLLHEHAPIGASSRARQTAQNLVEPVHEFRIGVMDRRQIFPAVQVECRG